MERLGAKLRFICVVAAWLVTGQFCWGQPPRLLMYEQGRVVVRNPALLPAAPLPRNLPPPTVRTGELPTWKLSLDEAIRIALQNADAIRVLSGVGAASSGLTIYSPAIRNTSIDQARGVFDPTVAVRNNFFRRETPLARESPPGSGIAVLDGTRSEIYDFELDVNKRFLSGADAGLRVGANRDRTRGSLLNPRSTSAVELSLTQPLLQGRGVAANSVPLVLAFLDTEQSYFRLKDALQNTLVGVVQGYWDLVQARTNRWVLRQQIQQVQFAYDLAAAGRQVGTRSVGEVAQTRATLANFRANLVTAESIVLDRVASLRGILGLPPSGESTIVPTTPPVTVPLEFDWDGLLQLAETRRPDLIELKLILEADQQRILLSRNQAQPQLDAIALYRWNGLEGVMPIGDRLESPAGAFTDWTLGVTFTVPLTLRAERANLRQDELLLASDRTNLQQRLLEVAHRLAFDVRTLDQLYRQYVAFQEARAAAAENLVQQLAVYREGIAGAGGATSYLDYLLAINTWADSVTSESRSITQFNTALASLERETGTILETHGVRLFEERYCSLGPLGRWGKGRQYPATIRPAQNTARYQDSDRPSEESFNLRTPVGDPELNRLPPPEPEPAPRPTD